MLTVKAVATAARAVTAAVAVAAAEVARAAGLRRASGEIQQGESVMDYRVIALGVLVLALLFLFFRGDRRIKERDALNKRMNDVYGTMAEVVDDVIYQGGFPPMPKPARMSLGITESELVLFDRAGNNGCIEYEKIKKVDKFTTRKERTRKFGIMAYGPLALVLNKPSFRHFFVVEYIDMNNEDNIMVSLVRNKEIADNLCKSVKPHIKYGKKKK
ncbi:MAG: hypothetical protein LBL49_01780 [Clostridiales Family XIII bacterium]|jgi:hypothetical protein|nr:hypothetical protein [Clostridiales Family XIII bacterium]